MNNEQSAREFFEACETGKGWDACKSWCHPDAGFSCQADALAQVTTLEGYTEWVKGLATPIPDGHYELEAFAMDNDRNIAIAAAVFVGTQTGEGGPVPPTGKKVATDYVYVIKFDGNKINHMTKVWNDLYALRELGWA